MYINISIIVSKYFIRFQLRHLVTQIYSKKYRVIETPVVKFKALGYSWGVCPYPLRAKYEL